MKKQIVYILGLSHTGSTLLDMILGNLSSHVGLGEIYQVLKPGAITNIIKQKVYCSCGRLASECIFWGNIIDTLKVKQDFGVDELYDSIIEIFDKIYGPETVLIDSSKLLKPLEILLQNKEYEISVIYIIRDVRAWTISRIDTQKKFPMYFTRHGNYIKRLSNYYGWKFSFIKWAIPLLTRTPAYFFWVWYRQNKAYKDFLIRNRIRHIQIGYDELGMNKDLILPKIHQFLGMAHTYVNFSTENSKSHILVGNVRRSDPERRKNIIYDNRWLYRKEWLTSAAIFRNIMNYNSAEVYRNVRENSIW